MRGGVGEERALEVRRARRLVEEHLALDAVGQALGALCTHGILSAPVQASDGNAVGFVDVVDIVAFMVREGDRPAADEFAKCISYDRCSR